MYCCWSVAITLYTSGQNRKTTSGACCACISPRGPHSFMVVVAQCWPVVYAGLGAVTLAAHTVVKNIVDYANNIFGIRTGQGELRGHMTYHVSCEWEPEEATGINLHNLPWLTCWTHQDHKGLGLQLNCASGPMHCCHSPLESSQSPRDSGHGLTGY